MQENVSVLWYPQHSENGEKMQKIPYHEWIMTFWLILRWDSLFDGAWELELEQGSLKPYFL